jgi:hypothetical protein
MIVNEQRKLKEIMAYFKVVILLFLRGTGLNTKNEVRIKGL